MKTAKNSSPFSSQTGRIGIEEATALAMVKQGEEVAKALFIEIINLHADQRRDWGQEQTFGTDLHFLLLRKFGIHHFPDAEMVEIYGIVKAHFPDEDEDGIKSSCRFMAYNRFLDKMANDGIRIDESGKWVFRAITSEYVSPHKQDEPKPDSAPKNNQPTEKQ